MIFAVPRESGVAVRFVGTNVVHLDEGIDVMVQPQHLDPQAVIARLHSAINRHDLDAFVACFAPDYRSEPPLHPDDAYTGRDQVRKNWARAFSDVPDIHAELERCSVDGEIVWTEWHWQGTWTNGTSANLRGVIIFGVRDRLIQWGRVYMEPVQQLPADVRSLLRA